MSAWNYEQKDLSDWRAKSHRKEGYGGYREVFRGSVDDRRIHAAATSATAQKQFAGTILFSSIVAIEGVGRFRNAVDHDPNDGCGFEMLMALLDVGDGGVSDPGDK